MIRVLECSQAHSNRLKNMCMYTHKTLTNYLIMINDKDNLLLQHSHLN